MEKNFSEAIKLRRSYYDIGKEEIISDKKIKELIDYAVKHTPSAFNSQTARLVILLGENHTKLWEITREALREVVPENDFDATDKKIDTFSAGYGTVLFFEENSVVEDLQKSFPLYKDNFPVWSLESSGMVQFNVWTSLELEGYGASLQHYNELIEEKVKKEWNIDESWKMRAQMPFGKPMSGPGEKEFAPLENRVKIYK